MTMPASGQISMSQLNNEFGRPGHQISLHDAETGYYGPINQNSPSRPDGANPNALSEWYGYDNNAVGAANFLVIDFMYVNIDDYNTQAELIPNPPGASLTVSTHNTTEYVNPNGSTDYVNAFVLAGTDGSTCRYIVNLSKIASALGSDFTFQINGDSIDYYYFGFDATHYRAGVPTRVNVGGNDMPALSGAGTGTGVDAGIRRLPALHDWWARFIYNKASDTVTSSINALPNITENRIFIYPQHEFNGYWRVEVWSDYDVTSDININFELHGSWSGRYYRDQIMLQQGTSSTYLLYRLDIYGFDEFNDYVEVSSVNANPQYDGTYDYVIEAW